MKFVNVLKSRLVFNILYFTYLMSAYLRSKTCFYVKSSACYFQMKAKILADFQIRISVPFTHLTPRVLFYTPRKHQKSRGALIFFWLNLFCVHVRVSFFSFFTQKGFFLSPSRFPLHDMFLQREMGPRGHIKGNTQLFRQNDFIWIKNQTYILFKSHSLGQSICMLLQKETSECRGYWDLAQALYFS